MKIQHRLEVGFGIVILMLGLITGLSAWLITQAQHATAHLESTCLQQMELSRLLTYVNYQMKELADYAMFGDTAELVEFQDAGIEVASAFDQWKRLIEDEVRNASDEHRQEEMTKMAAVEECQSLYIDLMAICRTAIEQVQSGNRAEAMKFQEREVEVLYGEGLKQKIQEQLQYDRAEISAVEASTWAFFNLVRDIILISSAIALVCAAIASRVVTGSIVAPLGRLRQAAARIGQGRLDTVVESSDRDEVGELAATVNQMTCDLRQTTTSRNDLQREVDRRQKVESELEAINEELSQFAYVVSHDLKAPLRGIKLISEYLHQDYADKLGDEGLEQLDLLKNRVGRMHNLIEGVLQYSRVGRIQDELTVVDLNELIAGIIDMITPPAHMNITVEGTLPEITCEKTRMMQVFQNLLSNAVKYMDKPEGQIVIACSEDQDAWTFRVSDNGPGIEGQHFDRIFQIFQTLNARDEFESTGVGLTLVKKIIEAYGGRIWVESEVGQGTTFLFTFPKRTSGGQTDPLLVGATSGDVEL